MSNISSAEFCFSAHRARSINDGINIPFYIFAPDFRDTSGGIRVLHYLCHILNEMGEEAYLVDTKIASPRLRTPKLSLSKLKQHFLSGLNPVTIYPEIISDNPVNTPLIARWLLNVPGHLGKPIEFEPKDLLLYYEAWCLPKGMTGTPLFMHPVDHNHFNNDDNPDDNNRTLECFYAHKYHLGKKPVLEEHKNLLSLGQEIKRTHAEIAGILRKSKVLYLYEPSGILSEAQACGCPVILVRSEYWPLPPEDTHHKIKGLAIYGEENCLEKARKTLPQIPGIHAKARDNSWAMTKDMVHTVYQAQENLITHGKPCRNAIQELWALDLENRKKNIDLFDDLYRGSEINFEEIKFPASQDTCQATDQISQSAYQKWLGNRYTFSTDEIDRLEHRMLAADGNEITFNIFVRLDPAAGALLADTLDSLAQQVLESWHLDVITTLPAPAGIEDAACVSWHTVEAMETSKQTIDHLVDQRKLLLNIEIPAGTWLDPLFLWRLAKEFQAAPDTVAFFVDDDCHGENGSRFNPRFKPGTNPTRLFASDLAGPICIRNNAWLSSGGASQGTGSPWFSQLVRIVDKFGWPFIRHIPDVLLSYPDNCPSDIQSCLISLVENQMKKGIGSEIVPATSQSWNIRYPLATPPPITIAILSRGLLDYLPRCFDSIIDKTKYPDFEIIIVVTDEDDDPDLAIWLSNIADRVFPRIRTLRTSATANHATRCNSAVQASANEFVVLMHEEAVVIQEQWLDELVRTCAQPDIAAVAPCLMMPRTGQIYEAGGIIGLKGLHGSPYQSNGKLGEPGYLAMLRLARDTSVLADACLLIRKERYLAAGSMDETALGDFFSGADLCLKLRAAKGRLIFQPLATVVYGGPAALDTQINPERSAQAQVDEVRATVAFSQRWFVGDSIEPFWNANLSLGHLVPTPVTYYNAQWQALPSALPRIAALPLMNGQGHFRITAFLTALRKVGMASECVWAMDGNEPSAADILRLSPDSIVVHHYMGAPQLGALESWRRMPNQPFVVFAMDDLITQLDPSNPFRKINSADSHVRMKYALQRCDRMVVSTEFLAEKFHTLMADIRIVPNCLEQELWLPLSSRKRTSRKPRIGWAGGTTHQGDLVLIKEAIEQTCHEADWVFFGMCPEEIRPLIAEYHEFGDFHEYPARLAALNLDLAVAPLAQTPFNQAKSNLRLLEYGVLGIPVVCTDIDPYRNSPACCVANTTAAWTKALRERIFDADAREQEGRAMRQWVRNGYLLENHLEEWLSAHLPG